jgi:hypothetical protein
MSDKFNELIELIISEETDQAKALFHEIIVDKSRSIYESLIDEDEVVDEAAHEEADDEEDEELEESDFDEELGGDAAEEFIDDISADEEGLALEDEDEDEEEMEDRVVDLEDALDELKAEFEKMMGGDDEDEMDMDMEPEMDDMEMDMEPEEDEEAEEDEEDEMDETIVREYTEKVAAPSNTSEKHVSPVAGKNDMGGSAKNIAQGGDENGAPAPTAKVNDAGNVNKPGAKVKPVAAPKPKATA